MNISQNLKFLSLLLLLAVLSACASGTKFSEASIDFEAVPGKSKLFIYRTQLVFGSAVQPGILVNGQRTNSCAPKGVFVVYLDPGKHVISSSVINDAELEIHLDKGEEVYVKCHIGIGIPVGGVYLNEVRKKEAADIVQNLVYTGSYNQ